MEERVKTWAAFTVVAFGGGVALYLLFRYLAGVLLPFLIGWGLAMLVRRPAARLHEKTRLPLGVARLFLVVVFALLLGTFLVFALRGVFREISLFLDRFAGDGALLSAHIRDFLSSIPLIGETLARGDAWERGLSMLLSVLPELAASLADVLPSFFFTLGVGVLAAIYFCLDLDRIHAALSRRLSGRFAGVLRFCKDSALRAALSVLRAQGLLALIAFFFLLVGFLLLGIKYPLLLSGLFALLDFLPVLGVGLFLVPWGVVSLLAGERWLGIGLLVLFGVIAVVRQALEPRLLGRGYGVHPLLTLLSLYAGARLFGFLGLLAFPALTLLLHELLFSEEGERDGAKRKEATSHPIAQKSTDR